MYVHFAVAGLYSPQMAVLESLITMTLDDMGEIGKKLRRNKALLTVAVSCVLFLLGLPMVTKVCEHVIVVNMVKVIICTVEIA